VPQKQAPLLARAASVALIALGYKLRKQIAEQWNKFAFAHGALEVVAYKTWIFPKASMAKMLAMRWGLQAALELSKLSIKISTKVEPLNGAVMSAVVPPLVAMSYRVFDRKGLMSNYLVIYQWAYLGWLFSLLTGDNVFFLHSLAFSASLLQGIAHEWSGQRATLPQLHNAHHELAHCTYFPALVVHRLMEHLRISASLAAGAAAKSM